MKKSAVIRSSVVTSMLAALVLSAAPANAAAPSVIVAHPSTLTFGSHLSRAKPSPPRRVTAVEGFGQARVSWSAPSTPGSRITRYTVVASPSKKRCSTSATLQCDVIGLANGVPYRFSVTATNSHGTSVPSTAAPIKPTADPPAPVHVTAVSDAGSVIVSWTPAPYGGGATPLHYVVTPSPKAAGCTITATKCTLNGLIIVLAKRAT